MRSRGLGRHANGDAAAVEQPEVAVGPRMSWAAVLTRLVTVGLWLLVLSGPVLGAAALVMRDTVPVASQDDSESEGEVPGRGLELVVGEFGARFVSAWLGASADEGGEDALAEFVAVVPGLPETSVMRRVGAVRLVGSVELEPGLWSVTIAGEVELAVDDSGGEWWGPVTKFWRVGVRADPSHRQGDVGVAETGLVATSLPSEVPPPARAGDVESVFGDAVDGAPGALGEAVGGFLALYLTGDAEVQRYTTPEAGLAALPDTGVVEVEVLAIAAATPNGEPVDVEELNASGTPKDGARVRVLATVLPRTDAGELPVQQYALSAVARAGRWEVAGLEPAVRPQAGSEADNGSGTEGR